MSAAGGARHFHQELAELKSVLLEMSSLAEDLVRLSVDALQERDAAKSQSVILGDRELDAMEVEIDERCIRLLALQQPLARDLRLITMAMKISNDLERVGDHAVNIAQAVERLAGQPPLSELPEIEEMARLARGMLSDSLDHFVREDPAGAREVCARDDRVDALHGSVFRILLTHMMEDPRRIGPAMEIFLVSRNLERIADLATNVAEDVVFLVEGRSIKHGAERREPGTQ
ncbi:MAG TPA: phosphate signaling complex protein PhoU [Longimicrobiaceae bacterium]|nr:phosphate signaling complex protein PhoU [Longimicrobiaceae bacterium]